MTLKCYNMIKKSLMLKIQRTFSIKKFFSKYLDVNKMLWHDTCYEKLDGNIMWLFIRVHYVITKWVQVN